MNGQGACSLLLQLRPHRDDGVRARRRGAADATADVKRVAGDGLKSITKAAHFKLDQAAPTATA